MSSELARRLFRLTAAAVAVLVLVGLVGALSLHAYGSYRLDRARAEFDAAISPNGRWIVFLSDRNGPFEVFVGDEVYRIVRRKGTDINGALLLAQPAREPRRWLLGSVPFLIHSVMMTQFASLGIVGLELLGVAGAAPQHRLDPTDLPYPLCNRLCQFAGVAAFRIVQYQNFHLSSSIHFWLSCACNRYPNSFTIKQ
mgnify:CR=1 FL=1